MSSIMRRQVLLASFLERKGDMYSTRVMSCLHHFLIVCLQGELSNWRRNQIRVFCLPQDSRHYNKTKWIIVAKHD